jgi:hypothetical protein
LLAKIIAAQLPRIKKIPSGKAVRILFFNMRRNPIREVMYDWNFQSPHGQPNQFLTIAHLG